MSYDASCDRYPAKCEILAVIHLLHAKNMSAAEIHRELFAVVYGKNIMSEGTVRQRCRKFKNGRANKCSRWRAKWATICSEWRSCSKCWSKNLWKTAIHNFRTFVQISSNPQISRTLLYEIIIGRLGYRHKFCARWVPKMHTSAHKAQRMASALTPLDWYNKDGDEFLNHSLRGVTPRI
jgi:hypothetical protein